jgi:flagellar biosynthetic protein FliR
VVIGWRFARKPCKRCGMPEQVLITELYAWLLIFCRVGSAMMLMPGIGEAQISPQARLLTALFVSVVLSGPLASMIPPMPDSPPVLLLQLSGEIVAGVFLGTLARMLVSALHVAGMVVSAQSSLSSAMMFDATQSSQSSPYGILMTMTAVLLFFLTDLHHALLMAFADSYRWLHAGAWPDTGGMAREIGTAVDMAFRVGIQLAAPTIAIALLLNLAAGVLARIVPNLQVFFLMMPIQISVVTYVFMMVFAAIMQWFLTYSEDAISGWGG